MAFVDTAQLARYGLQSLWLDGFVGGLTTSNTYGTAQFRGTETYENTWGQTRTRNRDFDAPASFGANSASIGISNLADVASRDWYNRRPSTATARNYVNLYNASSERNPLLGMNPFVRNESIPDGVRDVSARNPIGARIHFETDQLTLGALSFTPNSDSVEVGDTRALGLPTPVMAGGTNTSGTNPFLRGATQRVDITFEQTNTIRAITQNGTRNSSSTSNTGSASLKITQFAKANGPKIGYGAAGEQSNSVGTAWEGTWTDFNQVDFSETNNNHQTTSNTVTISLDLKNLQPNADGLYVYRYSVEQPGGGTVERETTFEPGQSYDYQVIYNRSTLTNTLTGDFAIGGSAGLLSDNFDHEYGRFTGELFNYALTQKNAAGALRFDATPFGDVSADSLSIDYIGTATASTTVGTDFTILWAASVAPSSALMRPNSLNQPLALQSVNESSSQKLEGMETYDLAQADPSKRDNLGVSMTMQTAAGDQVAMMGSGYADMVTASAEGEHQFSRFRNSFLMGNHQGDVGIFAADEGGNSISFYRGDDRVEAASGQFAGLGKGNDRYVVKGGVGHQITLGKGKDVVELEVAVADSFVILDFDITEDRIELSGDLDASRFRYELVQSQEGERWSTYLSFRYDEIEIGTAYLFDPRSDGYTYFSDPVKMMELSILNARDLDLDALMADVKSGDLMQSGFDMVQRIMIDGQMMGKDLVTHNDWQSMDTDQRLDVMITAVDDMGSSLSRDEWLELQLSGDGRDDSDRSIYTNFSDMMATAGLDSSLMA